MPTPRDRATDLVQQVTRNDAGAIDELTPLIYDELRRLAAHCLRDERAGHTLQATALANEAYLRLVDDTRLEWRERSQFLAIAAGAMRRILVDHARAKGARKRGGDWERIPLVEAAAVIDAPDLDVLALDDALTELAALDERKARIVEMRFFAGLTTKEAAEALAVSTTTVEDDWYLARAWLRRRLG